MTGFSVSMGRVLMASTSSTSRSPATWIRSHLKWVAERVRDEMTAIPEITQADVVSAPPYEILDRGLRE